MPGYLYLAIAIAAEVVATTSMKAIDGFNKPLPLLLVVGGYGIAFWMMTPQDSHYPGGEQISPLVWRADSFYVMAELVIRGVGWAWLPRHVAQYPTYQGHLQELRSDWAPLPLVVELVCRRDGALGPAANWLADCLARELLRQQA